MPFRFKPGEPVDEAVRRIACEQIDRAIREIDDVKLDRQVAIHQVRKRCKKIRGLLRLIRPSFQGSFAFENQWFRETARALSSARDAEVMVSTFDKVRQRFRGECRSADFAPFRATLARHQEQVLRKTASLDEKLAHCGAELASARKRAADWSPNSGEFDALAGGLKMTYRRGRRAMQAAFQKTSAARFHEWRKRAKYHWYHMRLLENVWGPVMENRAKQVKELSLMLGEEHDLTVLRATLLKSPGDFPRGKSLEDLLKLIEKRKAQLRRTSEGLGRRIYAEKPKAFVARMTAYWNIWRARR